MQLGNRPGGPRFAVLLALLIGCLAAGAPSAQADDEIGIYFDESYLETNYDTPGIPSLATAYLVLNEPTASGGVGGWECRLDIDGPAQIGMVSLAGQSLNILTPPLFLVGVGDAPLPPGDQVLLAEIQLFVTDLEPVGLSLVPLYQPSVAGRMSYLNAEDMLELLPMTPAGGINPVATINGAVEICENLYTLLEFGEIAYGTAATRSFRVSNPGLVSLHLDVQILEGGDQFWLTTVSGVRTVAPGSYLDIPVSFTASAIADYEGLLQIGSTCPPLPLQGAGRDLVVAWEAPETIHFEEIAVGGLAARPVSIRNTGETVLELDWELAEGCDEFELAPAARLGILLQPGQSWSGSVYFRPTSVGPKSCSLLVGPTVPAIAIDASAREPILSATVDPLEIDFGNAVVGIRHDRLVRIHNTGEVEIPLEVSVADPSLGFWLPTDTGSAIGPGTYVLHPGTIVYLTVAFTPNEPGYFETEVLLGEHLGPVPVRGTGVAQEPACYVTPGLIQFGDVPAQVQESAQFRVMNTGNVPLTVTPTQSSPHFQVSSTPLSIAPGSQAQINVTFRPLEVGYFETEIDLGEDLCAPVLVTGTGIWTPSEDQNRVGLFYDPQFSQFESSGPLFTPFTLFLALTDCSSPDGVSGWECRLATTGGQAIRLNTRLEGQALNLAEPPNFLVGTGVPLLPTDGNVLLATFDFMALTSEAILFELHPLFLPSIPGEMAWLTADLQQVWPMRTITGIPACAMFNGMSVAVDAPPPAVAAQGTLVTIRWESPGQEFEACRVMRRQGELTAEPISGLLPTTGSDLSFTDELGGFQPGQKLYYSYGLYRAGQEVARSSEVEVTVPAAAQYATGLLPNVPNPFNPQTEIRFELERSGPARIVIFDVQGRKVRTLVDESLSSGPQSRIWIGRDDGGRPVPSGAYYVRLETDGQVDTRKILLLK